MNWAGLRRIYLNENALRNALESTQAEINYTVNTAKRTAESIIERLQRLIKDFDENGDDAWFNPLGELQSQGVELERLLAVLNAQKKAKGTLQYLASKMEETNA